MILGYHWLGSAVGAVVINVEVDRKLSTILVYLVWHRHSTMAGISSVRSLAILTLV